MVGGGVRSIMPSPPPRDPNQPTNHPHHSLSPETETGLSADGRQIVNRAREEAENYKENYGSNIPPSGACVCVRLRAFDV